MRGLEQRKTSVDSIRLGREVLIMFQGEALASLRICKAQVIPPTSSAWALGYKLNQKSPGGTDQS